MPTTQSHSQHPEEQEGQEGEEKGAGEKEEVTK